VPLRDPRRWLRGFVVALARAWNGYSPVWQQGQDSLAREMERVDVASTNRAQLRLLDGLLPGTWVDEDRWHLEACHDEERRLRLPDQGLLLIPLVAGERASIVDHDDATMRHIGYPVHMRSIGVSAAPASPDSLEALLGIPRARILRELERPCSNSELAEALQALPSTATYHVTALETAGLVARQRSGRELTVRRTARGQALLALYGGT
jgi:DNA-binding transcriptional ArsR family regulator